MQPKFENLNNNLGALKKWGENVRELETAIKDLNEKINEIINWDCLNQLRINFTLHGQKRNFLFYCIKNKEHDLTSINLEIDDLPLHSRYNPLHEGLKIEKTDSTIVLLGCGLGYNLNNLLFNTGHIIILIEPNPILLVLLFLFWDLSTFITSGHFRIIWKITEDNVYRNIKNLENINYNFIPHRACFRIFSQDLYLAERNKFWNYVEKKGVNLMTLTRFEKIWAKNLISNLNHYLNTAHPLNLLWGVGNKQPLEHFYNQAVLICAGPSLLKESFDFLRWLKKFRRKNNQPLIIAVDTALMPLMHVGLDPDIIFCVDPQPVNRLYLQGYKGDALLITDPSCDPNTLKLIPKPFKQLIFADSNFPLYKLLVDKEMGALAFGGSVSTNAFDFLLRSNIKTIYILGQDLA